MLSVITINETRKWDCIVRSFKDHDVNYLSGYAKAFQLHGDGEPLLVYYNDGGTRAMNVVMRRDIAEAEPFKDRLPANMWFDLSTPYGYGGFWVDGENYEAVNEAYEHYCREQGFVSEFVLFHLCSGYQPHYNGKTETHTHNVVRSLKLPLDEILRDFEHKVRKNLKRAAASGLDIEIDTTGERLEDFLNIYYGTMDRTGATEKFSFSKRFFENLNEMNGNYVYLHVLSEGQIISTELVLYGSENCYSFLGGTNRDFFHLRPNDFLKCEIIKWAKEKGLKRFILGGGYGDDDGIFKYKKSLAPNGVCDLYIGKKIFDEAKYEKLVGMRKAEASVDTQDGAKAQADTDNMSGFFPKYRADFGETGTAIEVSETIAREN